MKHIEREKIIVRAMVEDYCHHRHTHEGMLCPDCTKLLEYACERLDRCPYADAKPSCRRCVIHCYSPRNREQMRAVMAYMGPRMIFRHPAMALSHIFWSMRHH